MRYHRIVWNSLEQYGSLEQYLSMTSSVQSPFSYNAWLFFNSSFIGVLIKVFITLFITMIQLTRRS